MKPWRLLYAISGLLAQEPGILEKITVGGREAATAAPPAPLTLRRDLGIMTTPAIHGQIIHFARDRKGGMYETRAVVTPQGDYLLMFPDGGHYGPASTKVNDMLAYRSSDKGRTWQGPRIAFDIDYNQHGFVPLVPRGTQRIYAFGTQPVWGMYTRERGLQENTPIGYRYSDDDGHTWSEARFIRPVNDPEFRGMSVMRMCETDAGTWLLGTHDADWSYQPLITRQYMLRSEDKGKTWTLLPRPRNGGWHVPGTGRMEEARPINLGGGRILLMTRSAEGRLWEMRSEDDGKTWSGLKPTTLVHPDAPPMLFHLSDGKTLIALHHNRHSGTGYVDHAVKRRETIMDRSEVWASISKDEGRTWSEPRFLFATVLTETLGNPFRDYNCSYIDMLADGGELHFFVPHRWERALYLRMKESDLEKLPVKAEIGAAGKAPAAGPDLCIYGGTSGGVAAAVETARQGRRAVILEPGAHLGGMSSGGLGWTDFANKAAIGGLAREFYRRVGAVYGRPEEFNLEPHVAERVFNDWVNEHRIEVRLRQRLKSVKKDGARIVEMTMEDGSACRGRMFLDATYEGDLMARARVSYTVGRESNAQYGETLNGIQGPTRNDRATFEVPVDPYRVPGKPESGPLPYLLRDEPMGGIGAADRRIQAYNYRVCLTDRIENRIPIAPPAGYREENFELLGRWIDARVAAGRTLALSGFLKYDPLPNGKWDFNNRWPISTDFMGASDKYPEGDWATRRRIEREHEDYLRGFFHYLATNRRVPAAVREEMSRYGLAKDEFVDNGGWPHQIYVREARRMVSDYVMTEHHARGKETAPRPVALAAYGIDIHAARRIVYNGQPVNEGCTGGPVPHPYPVAYGSIVPREREASNLFVPFCLSASHVGFGSIRMEPVFMALSQSAAAAAVIAIADNVPVQRVDYGRLRARLLEAGQILEWRK